MGLKGILSKGLFVNSMCAYPVTFKGKKNPERKQNGVALCFKMPKNIKSFRRLARFFWGFIFLTSQDFFLTKSRLSLEMFIVLQHVSLIFQQHTFAARGTQKRGNKLGTAREEKKASVSSTKKSM